MALALFFVLFPLALYVPLLIVEMILAFRRLATAKRRHGHAYIHISWEITHTFLIFGVSSFVWLFSDAVPDVAHVVYWPLMVGSFFFVLRAIAYAALYYIPSRRKHDEVQSILRRLFGWIFALSHPMIVVAIVITVIETAEVLMQTTYEVNTQFLPYMWPGLIMMVMLGSVPIWHAYSTSHHAHHEHE